MTCCAFSRPGVDFSRQLYNNDATCDGLLAALALKQRAASDTRDSKRLANVNQRLSIWSERKHECEVVVGQQPYTPP